MRGIRGFRLLPLLVLPALIAPATALGAANSRDHGFVPPVASRVALAASAHALRPSAQRPSGHSCASCASPPLLYNGGPVAPTSTVYAIFWDPSAAPNHLTQSYKDLIVRYFTDLAASSGHPSNTNEVSQQYTDSLGQHASYSVTFGGSFDDPTPYPTSGQCNAPNGDSVCLNDDSAHNQIQNEVTSFVSAHGLPIDITHIYFVFTPAGVSSCDGPGSCSYHDYCAYHRFSDTSAVPLYANQPDDAVAGCASGSSQRPNNNDADITLSSVAHEHNETLTDPLGTGWWDSSGYEIGDECAYAYGAELGGPSGAQYNQLINGHHYQLQQEYSNAQANCVGSIPLTADFSGVPPAAVPPGQPITFDGSPSNEAGGTIASYSWDFGDGSVPASGVSATHSYAATGTYAVKLTLTDSNGFSDYKTESVAVSSDESPSAVVSMLTASPRSGQPTAFDATASGDPDGSISSYSWNFGDGSGQTTGATPSHTYAAAGSYTVTLSVTDSAGLSTSTTSQVTVDEQPGAAFTRITPSPRSGQPTAFDATASGDPDGSISSYSWDFGDGSGQTTGATPSHTYAAAGSYTVTLTVLDSSGATATSSAQVTVGDSTRSVNPDETPSAVAHVRTTHPAAGVPVTFDASGSSDPDGSIRHYSWSFGDGSARGTGVAPQHRYRKTGVYRVVLTVTDSSGLGASRTLSVRVALAGKITKVSILTSRRTRFLAVGLNAPGTLMVGSRVYHGRRAGTAKFRLGLSAAQLRQLRTLGKLVLRFRLTFVPQTGGTTRSTATLTLHE